MIRSGVAATLFGVAGSLAIFGVMAALVERAWLAAELIGGFAAASLGAAVASALRADPDLMKARVERQSGRAERHGEPIGRGLAAGQGGWSDGRTQAHDVSKPSADE